jgi:hypothetical protein
LTEEDLENLDLLDDTLSPMDVAQRDGRLRYSGPTYFGDGEYYTLIN